MICDWQLCLFHSVRGWVGCARKGRVSILVPALVLMSSPHTCMLHVCSSRFVCGGGVECKCACTLSPPPLTMCWHVSLLHLCFPRLFYCGTDIHRPQSVAQGVMETKPIWWNSGPSGGTQGGVAGSMPWSGRLAHVARALPKTPNFGWLCCLGAPEHYIFSKTLLLPGIGLGVIW